MGTTAELLAKSPFTRKKTVFDPASLLRLHSRGPVRGVGTHLHDILRWLGVSACSKCKTAMAEMDAAGPEQCEADLPQWLARLEENANTRPTTAMLSKAALAFGVRDISLTYLVRLAIQRARQDAARWVPDVTTPISTRHLLFHCYPRKDSDVWRWNVGQLLERWELFNGRKVIAIVTDQDSDSPQAVEQFVGRECEFMHFENQPKLREVATLLQGLERLWTTRDDEAVFYAHTKGITRNGHDGVLQWAEMMYGVCLNDWPAVATALHGKCAAGPFLKVGMGFRGSASRWHFSGTFYWFRPAALFARDWRKVDPAWWGAESYPSLHFDLSEVSCLFHPGRVPELDLYNPQYLAHVWDEWKRR